MTSIASKVLRADAAGPQARRIYDYTHIALAGLLPVSLLSGPGSVLNRLSDTAIGVAIPVHAHVAMNSVLSDYVPKSVLGASRVGTLACTSVALLGLLRLNLAGPGLTPTLLKLWHKPARQEAAAAQGK